jgi:hypothetical protein
LDRMPTGPPTAKNENCPLHFPREACNIVKIVGAENAIG